jgi:hypothetical protein
MTSNQDWSSLLVLVPLLKFSCTLSITKRLDSRLQVIIQSPNSWTKEFSSLLYTVTSTSGLKLVYYVNFLYGNLKFENSQDYAQKPQRNCAFMISSSVISKRYFMFKTLITAWLPKLIGHKRGFDSFFRE